MNALNQLNIYISSSWKNKELVQKFASALEFAGHEVYNFTDPDCNDSIAPPDTYPKPFDASVDHYPTYLALMPMYKRAVANNLAAIQNCDVCLLLLPCGSDAHADWGAAVGLQKITFVIGHPKSGDRHPVHNWAQGVIDLGSDDANIKVCLGVLADIKAEIFTNAYFEKYVQADIEKQLVTYQTFDHLRHAHVDGDIPSGSEILLNTRAWSDLISSKATCEYYSPSSTYAEIKDGKLGKLFDLNVYTDGFMLPTVQKLPNGIHVVWP